MKWWRWACMVVVLAACNEREEGAYQPKLGAYDGKQVTEYVVGINPLHNPQRLIEIYGPILEAFNEAMPEAHFRLEASRNYEEFEKKLYAGHFAFAMPNPYQAIRSVRYGYRIFGKRGDDADFRGIILVRKDSGIRTVGDLKGKAVAYPASTALVATMLPQQYLHTHGLNVNRDIENRYVGSQESAIMNVLRGHVAAAGTWPVPWKIFSAEHPELASQLEVKWQTMTLPNNAWVVRRDIPAPLVEKFATFLFTLQESASGRRMLERLPLSRFEPANEETYRPVRDFLQNFSRTVRPIEQ